MRSSSPLLLALVLLAASPGINALINYEFVGYNSKPTSQITINNTIIVNNAQAFNLSNNNQSTFQAGGNSCDGNEIYYQGQSQAYCQTKGQDSYTRLKLTNESDIIQLKDDQALAYNDSNWDDSQALFQNGSMYIFAQNGSTDNYELSIFNLSAGGVMTQINEIQCQEQMPDGDQGIALYSSGFLYEAQTTDEDQKTTTVYFCYYDFNSSKALALGTAELSTDGLESWSTMAKYLLDDSNSAAFVRQIQLENGTTYVQVDTFGFKNESKIKSASQQFDSTNTIQVNDNIFALLYNEAKHDYIGFYSVNATTGELITKKKLQVDIFKADYDIQLNWEGNFEIMSDNAFFTIDTTNFTYSRVDQYGGEGYIMAPIWHPQNNSYRAVTSYGIVKLDFDDNTLTLEWSAQIQSAYYNLNESTIYFMSSSDTSCQLDTFSLADEQYDGYSYEFPCDQTFAKLRSAQLIEGADKPSLAFDSQEDVYVYSSILGNNPTEPNYHNELQSPIFAQYEQGLIILVNTTGNESHYVNVSIKTGEAVEGDKTNAKGEIAKVDDNNYMFLSGSGFKVQSLKDKVAVTGNSPSGDVGDILPIGYEKGKVQYYFYRSEGTSSSQKKQYMIGSFSKGKGFAAREAGQEAYIADPLMTNNTLMRNNITGVLHAGVYANTTLLEKLSAGSIVAGVGAFVVMIIGLLM